MNTSLINETGRPRSPQSRSILLGIALGLAVYLCLSRWYAPPLTFFRPFAAHFVWNSAHGFKSFSIPRNRGAESQSRAWQSLVAAQIKPRLDSYLRRAHFQNVEGSADIRVLDLVPLAFPDSWGGGGLESEDLNRTPLMRAAVEGDVDLTSRLLGARAGVNARDYWERSPLLFATEAAEPSPGVVKELLARGANPNARDRDGYTPLLVVIMSKPTNERFEIVRDLINAGADPNSMDNSGQTALMAAAENGAFDTVRFLLAAGADPSRRTNYGETALSIATRLHFDDIVNLLIRAGEIK